MHDPVPRLTLNGLKILKIFAEGDLNAEHSGAEISKITGLGAGSLYPRLASFENTGWLKGRWEELNPTELKRPRRKYYSITGAGYNAFRNEVFKVGIFSPNLTRPKWT
jgi:PadR family transcriptional regulator, regulatory protein PadR